MPENSVESNENVHEPRPGRIARWRERERRRLRRGWRRRWTIRALWVVGGLLASFAAGAAYAASLQSRGWDEGMVWERKFMLQLHSIQMPGIIDWIFLSLPWLGTNITILPMMVIACAVLLWKGRRLLPAHLMTVTLGSLLLTNQLKNFFERQRPDLWPKRGQFAWSAFPSGHMIVGISVVLTVAIVLHRERKWRWPYYAAAALVCTSLVSRMYLGVHWPTDVLGGLLTGMVWLFTSLIAFRPAGVPPLKFVFGKEPPPADVTAGGIRNPERADQS